jgi:hypothetical protein
MKFAVDSPFRLRVLTCVAFLVGCNAVLDIPEVERRVEGQAVAHEDTVTPYESDAATSSACTEGQKQCGSSCVSLLDPATGCGDPSCHPCDLPHAKATCIGGACAIEACELGFGDCNGAREDGCEVGLRTDPDHCGECGTACFPGFSCEQAECTCTPTSCGDGTCDKGICICDQEPCYKGERCDRGSCTDL